MPGRAGDQQRIRQIQLLQAKTRRLSGRLANLTELSLQLKGLGRDPGQEIDRLRAQRAALAGELRAAMTERRFFANLNLIDDRFTSTLIDIGNLLWPWSTLELPTMQEGVNDIPQGPDASGEVGTAGLFQGSGSWSGMPSNGGAEELWWVHTWTCEAVLPPAPHSGSVAYQFGANIEATVYHTEGSGTLTSYVTIGTTSDVGQPIANWQTVGWPFQTSFPGQGAEIGGGVPVVGNIKVTAGQSAAISVIFGVVVSVVDGYAMFLPDSFGMGLLGQSGYTAWGKMQYRFNPLWVIEGVNQVLQGESAAL